MHLNVCLWIGIRTAYISCYICLLLLDFWLYIFILIKPPSGVLILSGVTQKLKLRGSTFFRVTFLSYLSEVSNKFQTIYSIMKMILFMSFKVCTWVQMKLSEYLSNYLLIVILAVLKQLINIFYRIKATAFPFVLIV